MNASNIKNPGKITALLLTHFGIPSSGDPVSNRDGSEYIFNHPILIVSPFALIMPHQSMLKIAAAQIKKVKKWQSST
jgi:hypothetical protein